MFEQQFKTPRAIRLELKLAGGDIHVTTADDEVSTVTLEGPAQVIEATRVELVGERLVVSPQRKLGWFGRFDQSLHVRATVPHHSTVEIVTAAADATLEGSFNGLASKSASGELTVIGEIDGDANVKSVSGDARLPHVHGDLSVESVSGNLVAKAVDGSVSVKSVSGDVRIGAVREGQVRVRSVSGDVELGVATGTRVDVDAGSASGDLSSEVPLSSAPSGDPGPTVVIRSKTVSGDFRIFRAA